MKKLVTYILCAAIGAVIALITENLSFFQFDNEFNIFELLYFLITTGIALFVTQIIDDALQRKRSQKDIIMHKIEELDEDLKSLYQSFEHKDYKYSISNSDMLFAIKRIGLAAKRCEKSIEEYYNELYKGDNFHKLNTRKLVRLCTSPQSKKDNGISCVEDIWTYSEERFLLIYKGVDELRSICYNNMIQLNNYN